MDINSPCYSPDDLDIIHIDLQRTGEFWTDEFSTRWEIGKCKCGKQWLFFTEQDLDGIDWE